MDPIAMNLAMLADYLLAQAAESPQGRASQRIDFGHQQLRMTAIGFIAGGELPEHRNPGEAVLQVVRGRIRLSEPSRTLGREEGRTIEVEPGTIVRIPDGLHSVEAVEPSVIVLTAVTKPRAGDTAAAPSPTAAAAAVAAAGEHAI